MFLGINLGWSWGKKIRYYRCLCLYWVIKRFGNKWLGWFLFFFGVDESLGIWVRRKRL